MATYPPIEARRHGRFWTQDYYITMGRTAMGADGRVMGGETGVSDVGGTAPPSVLPDISPTRRE
ncbi:hypothetical protein, partial [Mesorhizobium sp.]|uniref:hypothetical protein n=1 Tax=Mesorhizobium sp. TaxID=1871066 RepID=UPI0025F6C557